MKGRMHETKNSAIFNQNIKPCHSERSEESMQPINYNGFFATLRMKKLTYLAIKQLRAYDFSSVLALRKSEYPCGAELSIRLKARNNYE
ncbi:MAG: hypothetical protein PHO76_01995 [Methylotenera sp.]|nr:hypothetical protein [Methylotenera sp.]MDD4925530.1 hypothetical protein [Methylotenera sp.]